MARGVTQEQVTGAADALLARGERPTIEKVRAELGTGSPNTLLRLLETWWAELAGRLAAQARAQLPGIPEAVQRAMMTLWSEAVVATRQEAETRYEARERHLAERESDLQAQTAQIVIEEEARQQAFSRALHECEAAKEDLANERRRAEDLQSSLSTALHSLSEAQTTIVGLRQAGEDAQKAFRVDRERFEATEQRWLREVDRAREEAKAATREFGAAQTKLVAEVKHRLRLEEELADLKRRESSGRMLATNTGTPRSRKTSQVEDPLAALRKDFDALIAKMRTPRARAARRAVGAATGKEIGADAVAYANAERRDSGVANKPRPRAKKRPRRTK